MDNRYWHPDRSRRIVRRIVVTGDLVLLTAASFSTGDNDDLVDIPLLTDAYEPNRPLLTGASLAGALRSYLAGHQPGIRVGRAAEMLFGGRHSDPDGGQSALLLSDSVAECANVELRNGVKLDSRSRTAMDTALYDRTLWAAGTRFPLKFELLVTAANPCDASILMSPAEQQQYETDLKAALAAALLGLERERITLGGRKTRGCGRAKVESWVVKTYDMRLPGDLEAWIEENDPANTVSGPKIDTLLGVTPTADNGSYAEIRARFLLDGSLLIRTEGASGDEPDMIHHRARQATGSDAAILPGTGLAGAIRARAARIAHTIDPNPTRTASRHLVEEIFGTDMAQRDEKRRSGQQQPPPHASRLRVSEQPIDGGEQDLVQPRVAIDPFTGGARETALFSEQPIFSSDAEAATEITLRIKSPTEKQRGIESPTHASIGLILLTLKDLWTHDLPVGGESSVGRGRWRGDWASIVVSEPAADGGGAQRREWTLRHRGDRRGAGLELPPNAVELEKFVAALHKWIAEYKERHEESVGSMPRKSEQGGAVK